MNGHPKDNNYHPKDKNYQFLLKYFSREKIFGRSKALWNEVVTVLEKFPFAGKLRIDEESFQMFIIDYFTDIVRIKDFHNIERVNTNKIYAYSLYWFLRRRPVQIVEPTDNNFAINEKVALMVFFPKMLNEAGIIYTKETQNEALRNRLATFANLFFYNLKYRTYTQQSLELMIEAFLCGCNVAITRDD